MRLKKLNVEVVAHDAEEIKALKNKGFEPIGDNAPTKPSKKTTSDEPETPTFETEVGAFEVLSKKELARMAEDMGLSVKGLSKAQIIDVITKG